MSLPSPGREPVEELAEEFAARYRRGERPSLTEYTEKYPELAEQIRDLFPALLVMEQFGSVAGPPTGPFDPKARERAGPPEQLGDYRILREVGRGGMGVVYEAVQESLGRHVALKVLPFHQLINPTHLERFRREARAAAQLHHTNIVPVFGVGEWEGIHYYAMQFIQGQGLDVVLEEVRRLRSRKSSPAGECREPERDLPVSIAQSLLTGRYEEVPPYLPTRRRSWPARRTGNIAGA
jgi:eukaryotic-like serine/threonine-protein kinase